MGGLRNKIWNARMIAPIRMDESWTSNRSRPYRRQPSRLRSTGRPSIRRQSLEIKRAGASLTHTGHSASARHSGNQMR
jgi:hypothetical protein